MQGKPTCVCGCEYSYHSQSILADRGRCLWCHLCDQYRGIDEWEPTGEVSFYTESADLVAEGMCKGFIVGDMEFVQEEYNDATWDARPIDQATYAVIAAEEWLHATFPSSLDFIRGEGKYHAWETEPAVTWKLCDGPNCGSHVLDVHPCGFCRAVYCLAHRSAAGCTEFIKSGQHVGHNDYA
jgi:hypothetical protein